MELAGGAVGLTTQEGGQEVGLWGRIFSGRGKEWTGEFLFFGHVRRNEILNQVSQPLTELAWPSSFHVEIRREEKGATRVRIRHRPVCLV